MLPTRSWASGVLLLALCGCLAGPVHLEHWTGLYTTHFEGIPDEASICALIVNGGPERVEWVGFRLDAYSRYGQTSSRWRSRWVLREPLEPGQSLAVLLPDPPLAEEIELVVTRSGVGPAPRRGRVARAVEHCSQPTLEAQVRRRLADRTAPGIEIRPILPRNDAFRDVALER